MRRVWETEGSDLRESCPWTGLLLRLVEPLVTAHTAFLTALETRLTNW